MRIKVFAVVLVLCILFVGCTKSLPVNGEIVAAAFDEMEIDFNFVLAEKNFEQQGERVNRLEMVDSSDKDYILIHILLSSELEEFNSDEMVLITPEWIYSTHDMAKVENLLDANEPAELRQLLLDYTDLVDLALFNKADLLATAQALSSLGLSKHRDTFTLTGLVDTQEPLPSGQVEKVEFVYTSESLQEIHFRREHDYPSTYRESNYISGTHYYLQGEMIREFPSLNSFSQSE